MLWKLSLTSIKSLIFKSLYIWTLFKNQQFKFKESSKENNWETNKVKVKINYFCTVEQLKASPDILETIYKIDVYLCEKKNKCSKSVF